MICFVFENKESVLLLCFVFQNNERVLLLCFVFEINESVLLLMCFVFENNESVLLLCFVFESNLKGNLHSVVLPCQCLVCHRSIKNHRLGVEVQNNTTLQKLVFNTLLLPQK